MSPTATNRFLPFEWIAALRFLNEGLMQSVIIIGGVAIGVAVIVFMSALLVGMQGNIFRRVLSSQPHIVVNRPKDIARELREPVQGEIVASTVQKRAQRLACVDRWQKVRDQPRRRTDVTAVSPTAAGPAFAVPATSFSGKATILMYCSGSMPIRETA